MRPWLGLVRETDRHTTGNCCNSHHPPYVLLPEVHPNREQREQHRYADRN